MDDGEIIARIKQGEKELFGPLMERYYDAVYHFCRYRTGDADQAYDCAQETFLRVVRYLDNYVDRKRFKAWLFHIAGNVCNDYFRGKPRNWEPEEALDSVGTVDDNLERAETGELLEKALAALPDYQREAVILRFFYDFKIKEIAHITGVVTATAQSRLNQGLSRLKKLIGEEENDR